MRLNFCLCPLLYQSLNCFTTINIPTPKADSNTKIFNLIVREGLTFDCLLFTKAENETENITPIHSPYSYGNFMHSGPT